MESIDRVVRQWKKLTETFSDIRLALGSVSETTPCQESRDVIVINESTSEKEEASEGCQIVSFMLPEIEEKNEVPKEPNFMGEVLKTVLVLKEDDVDLYEDEKSAENVVKILDDNFSSLVEIGVRDEDEDEFLDNLDDKESILEKEEPAIISSAEREEDVAHIEEVNLDVPVFIATEVEPTTQEQDHLVSGSFVSSAVSGIKEQHSDMTLNSSMEILESQNEESEDEEKESLETEKLGQDWSFLMDLDLTETEEEKAVYIDPIKVLLNPSDDIKDHINTQQLPYILEDLQELVPEVESLLGKLEHANAHIISELHRKVHTLKGTVGQAGAMRARTIIHHMETVMEEMEAGKHRPSDKKEELLTLFAEAKKLIRLLETGEWAKDAQTAAASGVEAVAIQAPKTVRVNTEVIDNMVSELNEGRLTGIAVEEFVALTKNKLKDLEENGQRVSRMLRELELQAEMQIQSRRTQLQENGEDFDPLEFDRFTRLHELSRLMSEGIADILEVRREMTKAVVEEETLLAQQKRSLLGTQEKLHKTRLTPADAINDRLYGVVWGTAREIGKDVTFGMSGGRVELDRVLLEKMIGPLEHVLRNSVAHGIEMPQDRIKMGKPKGGSIHLAVKQEADRVIFDITDDGFGLNTDRIRLKAIEKGLWEEGQYMTDAQAAEMICAPGFSTAESVSQIAGRGVGMDAVRSEILGLGGRFEIISKPREGLQVTIQLPVSIASASVLVVEAGGEMWAFPIEMVEHVVLLKHQELSESREQNLLHMNDKEFKDWQGKTFKALEDLTGISSAATIKQETAPVLLLKERGQFMAVEVTRLVQVFEVPLRSAGSLWSVIRGLAGSVILPNGDAIFLIDPFRFSGAGHYKQSLSLTQKKISQVPLVMVVDDSLTVRKAAVRFLHKNGYESITAKDGQEALEILMRIQPSVILMDIEMPRMDGLDCTKNIRDSGKNKQVPIIMITSRTAEKHRHLAFEIGVNEYLGKPFKDEELLSLLQKYAPLSR